MIDLMQLAFVIAYLKSHGISAGDASDKVDKSQGAENANKILGTDENGEVTLFDVEQMVDMPIDPAPTENSTNPVSSGGTYSAIYNSFTPTSKLLLIDILRSIVDGTDPTDAINQLEVALGAAYKYDKYGDILYIENVPESKYALTDDTLSLE